MAQKRQTKPELHVVGETPGRNPPAAYPPAMKAEIKQAFLDSYHDAFNMARAAKAAGVSKITIWHWRKEDREFDRAIQAIKSTHLDNLEQTLYELGTDPKIQPNARVTAIFGVLNAHRSKRYRPDRAVQAPSSVKFTLVIGSRPIDAPQLPEKTADLTIQAEEINERITERDNDRD